MRPSDQPKILRRLIFVFIVLAVGIGVLGFLFYDHQKEQIKKEKQDELRAIADLKTGQIEKWRQERLNDAALLSQAYFVSQIQEFLETQKPEKAFKDILAWLEFIRRSGPYEEIVLLDRNGDVKISLPASKREDVQHLQGLIREATEKREILSSDLYRDETSQKICLDYIVPLFLPRGHESRNVGIAILRSDPHRFLYPLIQLWPTLSPTAETLLVRRDKDDVLFLNELRHQNNTALSLRFPLANPHLPAVMAVRRGAGVFEGIDYRGVKVLAAARAIRQTPWFLVAKIDQEEVYALIHEKAVYIAVLAGVLILAAGLAAGFFWWQYSAQFYERLYQTELEHKALEKRYGFLTQYANDIILLYDRELNIVEANDKAVASSGYSREELLQMNAMDLRAPEKRVELRDYIGRLEEKESTIFETVHRRKDKTTFSVEISTRMIEKEGKRYFQSIIRDITERKRYEEEREKLVHKLQTALNEVKTLSGLLPICSSCKKIRDDKGYWNQIETFISEHSEAEFSHSICPDCARRLYPEIFENEEEEKQ